MRHQGDRSGGGKKWSDSLLKEDLLRLDKGGEKREIEEDFEIFVLNNWKDSCHQQQF